MTRIYTGTPEELIELLAGPRQHDAHCGAWRWHLLTKDNAAREAAVKDTLRQMIEDYHRGTTWNAQ